MFTINGIRVPRITSFPYKGWLIEKHENPNKVGFTQFDGVRAIDLSTGETIQCSIGGEEAIHNTYDKAEEAVKASIDHYIENPDGIL